MTLRFIIGRAGSGKTHTCLEEIRSKLKDSPDGPPIIMLVPEQATFQMEYALTTTPGLGGLVRAQVLSFRRLAWRVLTETGGAARVPIGELGKRMVLRRFLEQQKDQLKVFSHVANRPGFADSLARSIGEFKIYCIRPNELQAVSDTIDEKQQLLKAKLGDMALLYRELEGFLDGRYTDPDDYLSLLAQSLADSPTIKNAEIWIDGFTGFTPQEFLVIKSLLKCARQVNVAICLDPSDTYRDLVEEDLFYPTWLTFQEMLRIAGQVGVKIDKPRFLEEEVPYRFIESPALAHLEENFFKYPTNSYMGNTSGVKLVGGANRRAEVEAAAREIINLCRDKGCHWRDIAVILRDVTTYHELITTIFYDHGIPFFVDNKRSVLHHPLIELIRSAIEIVHRDWTYDPIFRFLKTDLHPLTREEVDKLENYVLSFGLRGSIWTNNKDWQYRRFYTLGENEDISPEEAKELASINQYRYAAISALVPFSEKMKSSETVRDYCTAIYELLVELKVPDQLKEWSNEEEKEGNPEKAREHIQTWNLVVKLLDEVVETLDDQQIPLESFLQVLETGFENMRLGLIPPGLDQVVVGSLDRSRNPNLKAVFILGVSEGVLPARVTSEGLFNDNERDLLDTAGIELAPGSRRRTFDEQYLVYSALTRSSHFLWFSYPLADQEGRSIAPSPVIKRLKQLLPELEEATYQVEPTWGKGDDQDFLTVPKRVLTYLAASLREVKAGKKVNSLWFDVFNWYLSEPGNREQAQKMINGVFHTNNEKPIHPENAVKLYGSPIRASVSRFERFKSCPFSHFANYGLRLRERPVYQLAAPDMGEFYHTALKNFVDYLNNNKIDWGQMSTEECIQISNQVVDQLTPQLQNEILLSSARYRYLAGKLKKVVNRATSILTEHARRSTFRPIGVELDFGPGGTLPPVKIPIDDNNFIELAGRIDRIDMAQREDKYYLRVIDYKSSDNQLDLPDVYYGFKLQLLTYLDVALTYADQLNCPNSIPGAVLYFTVKEPLIRTSLPLDQAQAEEKIIRDLKMKGYLLANPEVIKMMDKNLVTGWSDLFTVAINKDESLRTGSKVFTEEQFTQLRHYINNVFMEAGQEIISGNVNISPYRKGEKTPCKFCTYKPLCQFDQLTDNKYRYLDSISADQFWALLQEGRDKHE